MGPAEDLVIPFWTSFMMLASHGHAPCGNHFVLSGALREATMHGAYPDLSEASEYRIARGRMIPTMPWEAMYKPLIEWLGVADVQAVLPNVNNFNVAMLKSAHEVFMSSPPSPIEVPFCEGKK